MSRHQTSTKSFTIPQRWDVFLKNQLLTFTADLSDPGIKFAELMRYALLKAFPELEDIDNAKSGTLSRAYLVEQARIFERVLAGKDMADEWKALQIRLRNGEFTREL